MGTIRLGDAELRWEGREAVLEHPDGALEVACPGGDLAAEPAVKRRRLAVLAADRGAVLADGDAPALHAVDFSQALLGARLAGGVAALVGRERVDLHAVATGERKARIAGPGGAARADLALAVGSRGFAVPFHDDLLVIAADGRHAPHAVAADFPVLRAVGGHVVAAGGSTVVLVDIAAPSAAVRTSTTGSVVPDFAAADGDVGAVATRDHVYVVDGAGSAIHEKALEGAIESVAVEDEHVIVESGGGRRVRLDRRGRLVM